MRNIDTIVRDTLGNQAVQIIQLQAKTEALEAALEQARSADAEPGPDPANSLAQQSRPKPVPFKKPTKD